MKEKYIHYEKAGDQYVGRVATGLNVNSTSFAVSCPYFEFGVDDGGGHEDASVEGEIRCAIQSLFLGGTRLFPQMYKIVLNCYASICYHFEFLSETLHARNRIRQAPLFQQCKDTWIDIAVVKYPWDATVETPKLTGIPPHVVLLAELKNLSRQMSKFKDDFRGVLVEELDARHLGGNSYHAQNIMRELETTRNQIISLIQGGVQGNVAQVEVNRPVVNRPNRPQHQSGWHVYGGAFHMLPQGWRVPSMTFVQMISMWLSGDKENGVPPLHKVNCYHWKGHATQYRRVSSDMKYLMSHVKREATSKNVWWGDDHEWTTGQTLIMYENVFQRFCYPSKAGVRRQRFDEFSWRTVVNLVRNHKGQLVGDIDPAESSEPELSDEV